MTKKNLIGAIVEQSRDPGLAEGMKIVKKFRPSSRENADQLAKALGHDLEQVLKLFTTGPVGQALSEAAPAATFNSSLVVPDVGNADIDLSVLLAALFDLRFQRSLYKFQLLMSKSSMADTRKLIRTFSQVDWRKFNAQETSNLTKFLELVGAGNERIRVHELGLQDMLSLMSIPAFRKMMEVAQGYARMMEGALEAYLDDKDFVTGLSDDNEELVAELEPLMKLIQGAEETRLIYFQEVEDSAKQLEDLMNLSQLVAGVTNRTSEVMVQGDAGRKLAGALKLHSNATLESQEAFLSHFMRLNQLLVANELRKGRLNSAMHSLNLYVKAFQAFVLILTVVQGYLLTASVTVKKELAGQMEGKSKAMAAQLYMSQVTPFKTGLMTYASGFAKNRHGRQSAQKPEELPAGPDLIDLLNQDEDG